jgi:hypothetical protein
MNPERFNVLFHCTNFYLCVQCRYLAVQGVTLSVTLQHELLSVTLHHELLGVTLHHDTVVFHHEEHLGPALVS